MDKINQILEYLGAPYQITKEDKEPCITRRFGDYEFEISGLFGPSKHCQIYLWQYYSDHREVVKIYKVPSDKELLKDILGYIVTTVQKADDQIQVVRED